MVTTRFYLDTRAVCDGGDAPIKIAVCKKGKTALYSVGIKINPAYWDKKAQKVINHPRAASLNIILSKRKIEFDEILLRLTDEGVLVNLSATEVKNKVSEVISPPQKEDDQSLFCSQFELFIKKCKAERTRDIYQNTLNKIRLFDDKSSSLSFDDVTKQWLDKFELWLRDEKKNGINTISIDLRNIRAVFNAAIDEGITASYPFRRKKIKSEETRKRSLSIDKIRKLFQEDGLYVDLFKLSFLLIGINLVDLCSLTEIVDGRINYTRSKTRKKYSIKVEPEALELINRHRGHSRLLCCAENYGDYKILTTMADRALKAFHDGLSLYWARHSWATIAASLDIPIETIAAALGHGYGNRTTAIYINFDQGKVDAANRKVIDWVLKNRLPSQADGQ